MNEHTKLVSKWTYNDVDGAYYCVLHNKSKLEHRTQYFNSQKLYNFILQHHHCAPAPMGLPLADQYIRSALPRFVARSKKVTHFDNCKAFFESIYDACNDKVSLELRYTAPKSHEGQKLKRSYEI